ncbi:hypothetical protein ACFZAG_36545 [Streptomyces sp. NPDC012403]|uniref:hypothetical protein n=1 Tax=Streptomyces sp. NPDC012403 TaxID=3364831 RepID=UPI0036EBB4D9
MNHNASLSAPPRRTRRTVFLGLAVLGAVSAALVVRRPLMMAAPMCVAGRWQGCFGTFNGVVLMTLAALPSAALVVWALARRRRAAGVTAAWRMSLAEVGMVHGTVPFAAREEVGCVRESGWRASRRDRTGRRGEPER